MQRARVWTVDWLGAVLARRPLVACALAGIICEGCAGPPDVVALREASPAVPELLSLSGDLETEDPSPFFDGETYWVFSGGERLPIRVSTDLVSFERQGDAFDQLPAWVADEVPNATSFWQPEIAYFGGRYHLYYAVSTQDSSDSCIGHASAEALGTQGAWIDEGPLLCSEEGQDWNAIHPAVLVDHDGKVWMVLGSYRSGLKLIALDDAGRRAGSDFVPLAARPDPGWIQAPAIVRHGDYYYLFAAFERCCLEHRLMVGRASRVLGPYVDRDGVDLLEGGGTLVIAGGDRWRGPGANDVLEVDEQYYNFYRAYDAENEDRPTLRVSAIVWDELGWPISAGP